MILKKKISCKRVWVRKKKIPAQDHRPKKKKNSRTYSGLEKKKKFWQNVPCADTVNFCISKMLNDLDLGIYIKEVCSPQVAFSLNL